MKWQRPMNSTIHWHIEERGQQETLITWRQKVSNGEPVVDAHGDVVWEAEETPVIIAKAYQTNTKVPVKMNNELGQVRSFDFEFFSTHPALRSLNETLPSVGRVPVLTWNEERHRITNVENMSIGACRIITEEERR